VHPIIDASAALNSLYGHIDAHALTVLAEVRTLFNALLSPSTIPTAILIVPLSCLTPISQVHAPLFAYHFWNSTSALDCVPANRHTVTEQILADPLVSLLEHGSLRDDVYGISQQPKVKYAGAYIGQRTSCLPGTKCRFAAAAAPAAAAQ
jgi:hypothetical protein